MVHRTALKILHATIGVESNSPDLLPRLPFPLEVKSLLTDFHRVEEVPFTGLEDGRICLMDAGGENPSWDISPGVVRFRGPLRSLEAEASDPRFSLWGNQGFLYRYTLFLLEHKHRTYSLHACAVWDASRNKLYVAAGGAGSGKTVYLLSGLDRGLKLFSTETVHFSFEGRRVVWHMGSLADNIRLETLVRDFPRFRPAGADAVGSSPRQGKVAVDLSVFRAERETLSDPEVILIFPRIEEGLKPCRVELMTDVRRAGKRLFDNITQKIAETVVLYDRMALPGMDSRGLAADRLEAVTRLVSHPTLRGAFATASDPAHCWADFLDGS